MILYFSGTGNTKWAAETLAKQTGESLLNITDKTGEVDYSFTNEKRVIFCFPIHGWQPPRILRDFIKNLHEADLKDKSIYALCTCGDSVGNAINILRKDLKSKGWHLNGAFSLIMPESYVCLPFMYTDKPERERQKIQNATDELKDIAVKIKNNITGIEQLHKGATPWIYTNVIGEYFNKRMITDRPFNVDSQLCIGCGKCQSICPTCNISLKNAMPQWQQTMCTCCLACYHHCPTHAINYGRITKKRGQYYFGKSNNK